MVACFVIAAVRRMTRTVVEVCAARLTAQPRQCRRFSTPSASHDTGGSSTRIEAQSNSVSRAQIIRRARPRFRSARSMREVGGTRVRLGNAGPMSSSRPYDRPYGGGIRSAVRSTDLRLERHIVWRMGEQLLDFGVHGRPVLLQRHAVIATPVADRAGDVGLCPHGIHGDQSTLQIEMLQQQRNRGDLVGFLLGRLLPEHDPLPCRPGGHEAQGVSALSPVVAALAGLAVALTAVLQLSKQVRHNTLARREPLPSQRLHQVRQAGRDMRKAEQLVAGDLHQKGRLGRVRRGMPIPRQRVTVTENSSVSNVLTASRQRWGRLRLSVGRRSTVSKSARQATRSKPSSIST